MCVCVCVCSCVCVCVCVCTLYIIYNILIIYVIYGCTRGIMIIVVGNGHGVTSSNPGRY